MKCMNAVMRKCDMVEAAPVPGNENDNVAIQVAELRSDVRHIQADANEIKANLRVTNLRFDRFDEKLESLREKTEQGFASLRKEMHERIESLREETNMRFEKVDTRFDKIEKRFEKVDERFDKLEKRIDDVKDSLGSAKIWALGLYIGLAGSLFYVLAHGFKWL